VGRVVVILGGVLVLALLAGGFTEATLAVGHRGGIADDALLRPSAKNLTPKPSPTPSAVVTPAATATPAPTPSTTPVPATRVAVTNSFVHLRAGKSIYTNILTDLNAGTQVQLLPDADAQWQQVQYNGLTGYIFKTYLTY
jgi:uncharacterized protein YgiM (DUF1202 family)